MNVTNGDPHLSPFYRRLFAIHRRILVEWECYTLLQWRPMNVPAYSPGLLVWMVPRDCPNAFELHAWLERELQQFSQEPIDLKYDDGSGAIPGQTVEVIVCEFSGIDWYVDRDTVDEQLRQLLKKLQEPPH